ncbi:hypothetical protein B0H19DRAFT_1253634 [Mycena capillaripes]|nr:hypothetical protein B0H19DRAFT_1253634 [Mycena capillaripes]
MSASPPPCTRAQSMPPPRGSVGLGHAGTMLRMRHDDELVLPHGRVALPMAMVDVGLIDPPRFYTSSASATARAQRCAQTKTRGSLIHRARAQLRRGSVSGAQTWRGREEAYEPECLYPCPCDDGEGCRGIEAARQRRVRAIVLPLAVGDGKGFLYRARIVVGVLGL